jgi:hypothetical protein
LIVSKAIVAERRQKFQAGAAAFVVGLLSVLGTILVLGVLGGILP